MEELAVSELAELLGDGQPKVSRHAAALREAGLLDARRQGTWLLLRLARDAQRDPVVADALAAGQACCQADGTLGRVAEVLGARDLGTREFFARGGRPARSGPPEELAAYLRALAPLVSPRRLAVDAGTGDGALLEVLAPVFEQVIALDRSPVQLELAEARAARRAFRNVRFVRGEIDGPEVAAAVAELGGGGRGRRAHGSGADAVFAARVLHHAAVPSRAMEALARLARPRVAAGRGGGVFILEYEGHRDEALREQQADLWLGFAPEELVRLCGHSGLEQVEQLRLPQPWCGAGADRHLAWQLVVGWRGPPGRRAISAAVGHSS